MNHDRHCRTCCHRWHGIDRRVPGCGCPTAWTEPDLEETA